MRNEAGAEGSAARTSGHLRIGALVNEEAPIGHVKLRRYLDRGKDLAVTVGTFTSFFRAYQEHVHRWELDSDGLTLALMREGLAAAALHMVTRPLDETFGVTVNIHTPPLNLFLAGDAWEATLTGRAFVEGVRTSESGRFFVQSRRRRSEPVQSAIDVEGLDVLGMFEDYYRRSEQNPARFFDLDRDRFLQVLALPGGSKSLIEGMEREEARSLVRPGAELLGERSVQFSCGCNLEKILVALHGMFDDPEELFQGDDRVEVNCPRCGARWTVTRDAFEKAAPADDD